MLSSCDVVLITSEGGLLGLHILVLLCACILYVSQALMNSLKGTGRSQHRRWIGGMWIKEWS